MANKGNPSIYSIVEKAYFRLQAGDVLTHCIEDGSTQPIHEMIQEMVLAGPQSIEALREILGEAIKRKSQVYDDLNQVTNQLTIILKGYGISLDGKEVNPPVQGLTEDRLALLMDEQGVLEKGTRTSSLQVMKDSRELINTLNGKILLLESIETYLQDWLLGLTYQSIRQGSSAESLPPAKNGVL